MREVKKTQRTKRPKKNQDNIMAEENKTTSQGDSGFVPPAAQNKFESSETHVRKAAEDLRSAAGVMAGDVRYAAGAMAGGYGGNAARAWVEQRARGGTW